MWKYKVEITLNNGEFFEGYYKTDQTTTNDVVTELIEGTPTNAFIVIFNRGCDGCIYIRSGRIDAIELIPYGQWE